jgi:Fe-S-cluster containining protein
MERLSLPVLDPSRTEFGYERTHGACAACTAYCYHIPGYLIPADLARIAAFHQPGLEVIAWAHQHLLASPGALVARHGRLFRIPTLAPARRADGACIFLTPDGACAIHPVAPYACAFFDHHLDGAEADRRSTRGLVDILQAFQGDTLYAWVWTMLQEAGRVAPAPEKARRSLRRTLAKLRSSNA